MSRTTQDSTEKKSLEERLRVRIRELEEANEKLKELGRLKSRFIDAMGHELRTPLNSVIGFSNVLLNGWSGPMNDEQKELLTAILQSGKRLLATINDSIDVSKIEAGNIDREREDFDLHDVLSDVVSQFSAETAGKDLTLATEPIHCRMRMDKTRLMQCLANLIGNAVTFTERGEVRVSARKVNSSKSTVQRERVASSEPDRDIIEISVADTGPGIRKEDMPKLFQPFVKFGPHGTKVPGAGLGLYVTRKLAVEVLQGDLRVESEEGKGSTFTLVLPETVRERTHSAEKKA